LVLSSILHHEVSGISSHGNKFIKSTMRSHYETHPLSCSTSTRNQPTSLSCCCTRPPTISRRRYSRTMDSTRHSQAWIAIQHGDADTITGHQLRASMELHILKLGLPGQLLRQYFAIFGHIITKSWLKHLWEFCYKCNIQIETLTPKLTISRIHDKFLMPKFAVYGYRAEQLYTLNLCRLFCHSIRLSDLTTGDNRHPLQAPSTTGHYTQACQ
jgi:hypothetical protein